MKKLMNWLLAFVRLILKILLLLLSNIIWLLGWGLIISSITYPFIHLPEFLKILMKVSRYLFFEHKPTAREFGQWVGVILLGAVGAIGAVFVVFSKRLKLKVTVRQDTDAREPVVYLRTFNSDKDMSRRSFTLSRLFAVKSEEEQMVEAFRELGPVIAIGKPGEALPVLGATRLYFNDEDWRQQVQDWFGRAALVVIRLPTNPSAGILWELTTALNTVSHERLVFLVPQGSKKSFDALNQMLQDHSMPPLPIGDNLRGVYGSRVSGIVYFASHGKPDFIRLVKPPLNKRTFSSPLILAYRQALQPVFKRLNGDFVPLSIHYGEAAVNAFFMFYLLIIIAIPSYFLINTTPFEWEFMEFVGRVENNDKLPVALRQAKSEDEVDAILGPNFITGLSQISDDDMYRLITMARQLLLTASDRECAMISRGQDLENLMVNLMNRLALSDRNLIRTFFQIMERILIASTHFANVPTGAITEGGRNVAYKLFLSGMSAETRPRFEKIENDMDNASDDDLCWHVRQKIIRMHQLGKQDGSKLARIMLMDLLASEKDS